MNYRTFKKDCPAHISLRINGTGNALEVKSVSFDHNHEISEVRACTCNYNIMRFAFIYN